MDLLININNIPTYLYKSDFYRSLQLDDNSEEVNITIPADCFKSDDTVENFDGLLRYLFTYRFWGVSDFSNDFFQYILGNNLSSIQCKLLCEEFPELVILSGLCEIVGSIEKDVIAAKHDNVSIFKYLNENGYELDKEIDTKVIEYGSLKCLQYLISIKKVDHDIIIDSAICRGYVHILEWLKKNNPQHEFKYSANAILQASVEGHIHVLEWLKKSGYKFGYTKWAVDNAFWSGQFEVLEWFRLNPQLEIGSF